jgi:hypothetical protein
MAARDAALFGGDPDLFRAALYLSRYRWVTLKRILPAGFFLLALALCAGILGSERLVGQNYEGAPHLWAAWWPSHALQNNYDMVQNNYALYPIETNWLPELSLPTSLIYWILKLPLGSLLGFNFLFPLYLGLTAITGFAFLKRESDEWVFSMLGGAALAFNPLTFVLAERGEIALLGIFVLPLWLLLWERFIERPTWGRLALAAIGLYAAATMTIQYWNLLLTLLLPYALMKLWQRRTERDTLIEFGAIGLLGATALFLIFPGPALIQSTYGTQYAALESSMGMVTLEGWRWAFFGVGGLLMAGVALLGPWTLERRVWVGIVGLNLLCLLVDDLAPLTLPGNIFEVPRLPSLTQPELFLIPAILGAGVLIAQGLPHPPTPSPLWRGGGKTTKISYYALLVISTIVVVIGSGWGESLPQTEIPHYAFYEAIAEEPEDYLVLEVPFGADSLARRRAENPDDYAQFRDGQIAGRILAYVPDHEKRVVGGLVDHLYAEDLAPYHATPLIQLLAFQGVDDPLAYARALRADVVGWRAAYVVLYTDEILPEALDGLRGWFGWTGVFCAQGSEANLEFWRAAWHPGGCPVTPLRIGGPEGALAAGSGWYAPEQWDENTFVRWAGPEETSTLRLWAYRPASDYTLSIRVSAPAGVEDQTLEVIANGESLSEQTVTGEEITFTVPQTLFEDGLLEVELRHSRVENVEGRALAAVYESFTLTPFMR